MRARGGLVVRCGMLREIGVACLLCLGCAPSGMSGETGDSTSPGEASEATSAADASTTATTGASTTSTSEAPTTTRTTDTTAAESETEEEEGNLLLSDRFLNIAHRGGARLRPEETLPAFEHALEVGADVLEFDVHATSDGVIVALHDATVDRTTDGTGAVKAMTLRELRALDAGYRFTPDGGETFPYRGEGIVVPTMAEILDSFPGEYFLIEIKQTEPPIVDGVLAVLEEREMLDRVVLACSDPETMAAIRAARPNVMTSLSAPEMLDLYVNVGNPAPAQFVHAPADLATPELVKFSHELGLKVHPWTVNGEKLMLDLIGRGVDGIMTDDPALLESLAP
jgi:glycerophosphoryl diester phosphodiesterase